MSKFGKRRCVFCDGQPVTREHAIPGWLTRTPLFADFVKSYKNGPRFQPRMQPIGPDSMMISVERFGTPMVNSITVKAVCKQCNGGWMSRLEDRVRPTLNSLMSGEAESVPAADVDAIRHWAMKSAFMFQLVDQSTRTVTREQLRVCATSPDLVPAAEVFVARYAGDLEIWPCHGKFVATQAADIRGALGSCGVTTLVLGNLAIAVIAASDEMTKWRVQSSIDQRLAGWVPLVRSSELKMGTPIEWADVDGLTALGATSKGR